MNTTLIVFLLSVVLFTAFSFLSLLERKRGRRYILGGFRNWTDRQLDRLAFWLKEVWDHFVHYVVRLGWYYSLHSFLRTILRMLVAVYDYIESHFERNRFKARVLQEKKQARNTESHLGKVAEHKEEVALSPDEKVKLREEKLEERD